MELSSTKGPSTWEAEEENNPDGVYKMTEFYEDDMEDGKPYVKIQQRIPPKPTHQVQSRKIFLIFKGTKRSLVTGMIVIKKSGPLYRKQ